MLAAASRPSGETCHRTALGRPRGFTGAAYVLMYWLTGAAAVAGDGSPRAAVDHDSVVCRRERQDRPVSALPCWYRMSIVHLVGIEKNG